MKAELPARSSPRCLFAQARRCGLFCLQIHLGLPVLLLGCIKENRHFLQFLQWQGNNYSQDYCSANYKLSSGFQCPPLFQECLLNQKLSVLVLQLSDRQFSCDVLSAEYKLWKYKPRFRRRHNIFQTNDHLNLCFRKKLIQFILSFFSLITQSSK